MRKFEVKSVDTNSAFKTTLYVNIIPMSIILLIGIILTLIGALSGAKMLLFMGIPYIIMPVVMIGLSGLINMITAIIYTKLAHKFGGLEIEVEEKAQS